MDQSTPDKNNSEVQGFNNSLLVALFTADTNKWATLLNRGHSTPELQTTNFNYERTGPMRQRQRRLSEPRARLMADKYQNGATVYQLAKEFGICRGSVSGWLKRLGIPMKGQSPDKNMVNSMIKLYESGLPLAAIAQKLGISTGTVHNHLRRSRVEMRDSHGHER